MIAFGIFENLMDNFASASFAPDLIAVVQNALEGTSEPLKRADRFNRQPQQA